MSVYRGRLPRRGLRRGAGGVQMKGEKMINDGYKAAFKGAMQAYGILAINAVRWIRHVTGTGGDSEAHYWPDECETCKEIAEFLNGWEYKEIG